jgi:hypothetical protein
MRDYSRTKRWSKHRKRPRSKMKKVEEYIKDTALPNDLLKLDLRYFNVSMRNLEELGEFYKENGRFPEIMSGRDAHDGSNVVSEDEKRLCRWLRVRRTDEGRNKKWRIVAKPLMKKLGLPTNTFKPKKVT